MLLNQVGFANHVVVEKEQNITCGSCSAAISRRSETAIPLFDNLNGRGAIQSCQR
jgi:hypothetical protein